MLFFLLFLNSYLSGGTNPVELGDVQWMRSMDEAMIRSKKECKPILILFQEVPGCSTCRNYGVNVLRHPLIVEAIETHFIPLAIYNNRGGHDGEILKRYNEPAWNNPVVRVVDEKGKDVVPRLNNNYSLEGLCETMNSALIRSQGKSPVYLQLLGDELAAKARGTEAATYSMYCFWTGEALFGAVNGVVATTAGWQQGKEVVRVEYNPSVISKNQLDRIAEQSKCRITNDGSFRIDETPKYYLSNHKLRQVPMTELQKARVNSSIAAGQDPELFLSPRQLEFLLSKKGMNLISEKLVEAWAKAKA